MRNDISLEAACKGTGRTGYRKLPVFMKVVIVCLAASFLVPETVRARDYEVRRRSGEYTVEVIIKRNPPVVGKNLTLIRIRDGKGIYVRGAQVKINYSMPPMPGMPPMNYTAPARSSGDVYAAAMDLVMAGPWNIVVTFRDRTKAGRIIFPIDVR